MTWCYVGGNISLGNPYERLTSAKFVHTSLKKLILNAKHERRRLSKGPWIIQGIQSKLLDMTQSADSESETWLQLWKSEINWFVARNLYLSLYFLYFWTFVLYFRAINENCFVLIHLGVLWGCNRTFSKFPLLLFPVTLGAAIEAQSKTQNYDIWAVPTVS